MLVRGNTTAKGRRWSQTLDRLAWSELVTSTLLTVSTHNPPSLTLSLSLSLSSQRVQHFFFFFPRLCTESEMKGTPDVLSFQELCQRLHVPGLTELVQPSHAQTLCFWGEEQAYVHVELQFGQTVRLKTLGDSPFIGTKPCSQLTHLYTTGLMITIEKCFWTC